MLNLINSLITFSLMLLSLYLGYKIYQKGLKDGLSLNKTEKLSKEPMFNAPIRPLTKEEKATERATMFESRLAEAYLSGDVDSIRQIQDEAEVGK